MKPTSLLAALASCLAADASARDDVPLRRPNIVVILADDHGYGDDACNNPARGKIATPQIDRLAREGMRFTDTHSSSGVFSPARYTLLAGRYHWRTRLQSGIVNVFGPPLIAPDRMTLAGLLRGQGYRTACVGTAGSALQPGRQPLRVPKSLHHQAGSRRRADRAHGKDRRPEPEHAGHPSA